jgi:hypothetical protein
MMQGVARDQAAEHRGVERKRAARGSMAGSRPGSCVSRETWMVRRAKAFRARSKAAAAHEAGSRAARGQARGDQESRTGAAPRAQSRGVSRETRCSTRRRDRNAGMVHTKVAARLTKRRRRRSFVTLRPLRHTSHGGVEYWDPAGCVTRRPSARNLKMRRRPCHGGVPCRPRARSNYRPSQATAHESSERTVSRETYETRTGAGTECWPYRCGPGVQV